MTNVPRSAFSFVDSEGFAKANEEKDGKNAHILGYSGKIIKGHWYWGDLAIDVKGARFPKAIYPLLDSHHTDRKVGFTPKPDISKNSILFEHVNYVKTPYSEEFQSLSKEGFPYEASISGRPLIVERLEEGATAEVNGFTMKGPGSIWRDWVYRETSVCVFGYDSNTKSKAMADEGECEVSFTITGATVPIETKTNSDKEVIGVTLAELKEKQPEVYTALMAEAQTAAKAEVEALFKTKESEFTTKFAEMQAKVDTVTEENKKMQKQEAIRQEKERIALVDSIWAVKLSESEVPERLYSKVRSQLSHEKFVKEGELDMEAFKTAIDKEIADWTEAGVKKSVLGMGSTQKDVDETKMSEKEDTDWKEDMLKRSGQIQPKK